MQIRPRTAKRLRSKLSLLIDICGNEAGREEGDPNGLEVGSWLRVDLTKLKYKELDKLEGIYRLWKNEEGFTIDLNDSWRQRNQQLLQHSPPLPKSVFDSS